MEHIAHDETSFVRPAEVGEMELYHAKTWLGKYVFSQDAKTIAIQYAATAIAIGMVALVLSWFMRLQLAWPNTFTFIDPAYYLQAVTMHGMIMVVYLLTALFLGGFGNYLIPLMVGARDMVFPWLNMISFWVYFTAVLLLAASFFVGGGSTGAGWTLYPPQAILPGTPGSEAGILLMLASLAVFIIGFTMGGLNYVVTILQARTRGMTLMRMPLTTWTLFSPSTCPDLHDKFGKEFEQAYEAYERKADSGELKLFKRMPAKDLWRKMLSMLFETGHPWITFKDACNVRSPQQHVGVVHSSNLCTERSR